MIDDPYPKYYTVHLSVQNVIRNHLPSDEYQNNLVQVLNTFAYYIQVYDPDNSDIWPYIRIIVAHCEILSNYLKKSNDSRLEIEDSFTLFERLGYYFRQECFLPKSLACLKYCQKLAENFHRTNHANMSRLIHNIGKVLQDQGKLDEAKAHYREVLEIQTKVYGTRDHPSVATTINSIGIVLQDQGKLDEAKAHYGEALEILTKSYGTRDHYEVAVIIHNIGIVLQRQGKLGEAEAHYREALEIKTRAYGTKEHPEVAVAIHNIGIVLQRQGKLDEAEGQYRDALEILTKAYGTKEHPEIAKIIHNIGMVLQLKGKPAEAEDYYRMLLKLKLKHMEPKIILRWPKPLVK